MGVQHCDGRFICAGNTPVCPRGRGGGLARMYDRAAGRTKNSNQKPLSTSRGLNVELPNYETPIANAPFFSAFLCGRPREKGMSAAPAPPGMSEAQGCWDVVPFGL